MSACTSSWSGEYKKGVEALRVREFGQAEQHLNAAVHLARQQKKNNGVAECLLGLARLNVEQGRFREARKFFEQALIEFKQVYGGQSHQVAGCLVELAACLYNQQEFEQAEPLLHQAMAIEEELPRPSQVIVATALNNLAEIHKQRGDDEHAEAFYLKAVALHEKAPEKRTARMAVQTLNNLAMLYRGAGRYAYARATINKAEALQKSLASGDPVAEASILNTLAAIERAQFNNQAAAQSYQKAIALLRKDKAHREPLCDTLHNYADLLTAELHLDEAARLYLETIEISKSVRGSKHPSVAERMVDLAGLYKRQGDYAQAENYLRQALAIDTVAFDYESPIVINTINDLSQVLVAQKKYAEASQIYADWLPQLTRELGGGHPYVADALDNWALVAGKADDRQQAQKLKDRARAIRTALSSSARKSYVDIEPDNLSLESRARGQEQQ